MKKIRVVILAGGQGKRMGASVPKPLVPIAGKPMICHLVESVRASGVDDRPVVVVSPAARDLFAQALGETADLVLQETPHGTADALRCAREVCVGSDGVMVLYGDHPFLPSTTIEDLARESQHGSGVVMLTATVPHFADDYAAFVNWGRVIRDSDQRVVGIREKKDASDAECEIREVNPGMYVFPAPWVWSALERISDNNASGELYLTDLISLAGADLIALSTMTVDALCVMGVNTPEELLRAERIHARDAAYVHP